MGDLAIIDLVRAPTQDERAAFDTIEQPHRDALVQNLAVIVQQLHATLGTEWDRALGAALKHAVKKVDPTFRAYEWNVEQIAADIVKAMAEDGVDDADDCLDDYLADEYHTIGSRADRAETDLVMARVRDRVREMLEDADGAT